MEWHGNQFKIWIWSNETKDNNAKQGTVEKVDEIVKRQLVVSEGTEVCCSTNFSNLGADSLGTMQTLLTAKVCNSEKGAKHSRVVVKIIGLL